MTTLALGWLAVATSLTTSWVMACYGNDAYARWRDRRQELDRVGRIRYPAPMATRHDPSPTARDHR